ncbi:MAG TPA: hypothetical protein VIA09_00990, partial [Nitrososphaeraceae archaeon]
MQKRTKYYLLLFLFVSMILSVTSLSNHVQSAYAQEQPSNYTEPNTTSNNDNIQVQTFENLSNFFGAPMFFETSHNSIGSIKISTNPLKTQDSYYATGILRDVGNV